MDSIYHFFLEGLWSRYATDHITLFFTVLIVAYTLNSYRRVGALCALFAFFTLIGMICGQMGLRITPHASFILNAIIILIPAFFCIFGVTTKPSTPTEKMGLFISSIAGLVYGLSIFKITTGNIWVINAFGYSIGLAAGVIILSSVILLISRLLEYISLSHRDIAIITSSVAIGMMADTVVRFVKDILA